jgi:cytochrome c553
MKAVLIFALLVLTSPFAHAGGDAGAGAQKSKPCAACHGADFNTPISADIPLLAGQYEDYLVRALSDYKVGARKNPIMGGQAGALSSQDILDLSAYISGLPGKLKVIPLHRLVQ